MKTIRSGIKNPLILFSLLILAASGCKKESVTPCATYDKDIKPILEKSCSYAGCHSGTTAGAYVPAVAKDFTNYSGLMASVDNGKLRLRALEKGDMPSPIYTPKGYPLTLTQDEKDMIQCWIESGAPEK